MTVLSKYLPVTGAVKVLDEKSAFWSNISVAKVTVVFPFIGILF